MARKTILAFLRLSPANAVTHLTPLVLSSMVSELHIVREEAVDIQSEKVIWHLSGRRRRLPPLLRLFRLGVEACRSKNVDVILGLYLVPYGLLAWLAAKLTGRPAILSLLGTDFNLHCHAWYAGVLRAVLRRADFVTVTGQSMLEEVVSWGVDRSRVSILPHAIDVERFKSETLPQNRDLELLYVGRLERSKRLDDVLKVHARVRESIPTARLAIVGDGPERDNLEAMAVELGVEEGVEFAGYRADVERFYADARLLLLASEREGLPLVLVEAMCSGCVPISTRCGTIDDLIEDGTNGYLVGIGDWETMAQCASETLRELEQLAVLSERASQVRERFAWDAAVKVWDELLDSLHCKR